MIINGLFPTLIQNWVASVRYALIGAIFLFFRHYHFSQAHSIVTYTQRPTPPIGVRRFLLPAKIN